MYSLHSSCSCVRPPCMSQPRAVMKRAVRVCWSPWQKRTAQQINQHTPLAAWSPAVAAVVGFTPRPQNPNPALIQRPRPLAPVPARKVAGDFTRYDIASLLSLLPPPTSFHPHASGASAVRCSAGCTGTPPGPSLGWACSARWGLRQGGGG